MENVIANIKDMLRSENALIEIPEYEIFEYGSLCDCFFGYLMQRYECELICVAEMMFDGVDILEDIPSEQACYALEIRDFKEDLIIGGVDKLKRNEADSRELIMFKGDEKTAQRVLAILMTAYTVDGV